MQHLIPLGYFFPLPVIYKGLREHQELQVPPEELEQAEHLVFQLQSMDQLLGFKFLQVLLGSSLLVPGFSL